MKNKKRGQAGIVSAFIVILSSLLVVGAFVTNSSNGSLKLQTEGNKSKKKN
jgi:hypothetical protein